MTPNRRLNLFDATMIVMGGIIGVGVFLTPQRICTYLGEPVWVLLAWAIGGLIAMTGAFVFAELGAAYPHSGGKYVYIRRAFGPFVAFVYACVLLFVVSTGALAVVADFFAGRLLEVMPSMDSEAGTARQILALTVIVVLTGANLFGIKIGSRIQNVCMILKLLAIVVVIGGGAIYAFGDAGRLTAVAANAEPIERAAPWQGLIVAILPVLFSFGGWQNLSFISSEVDNPQRNMPKAVVMGVIGVIVVYVSINWAYLQVLEVDAVATDPDFATRVARTTLGDIGGQFVNVALAISAFGICGVIVMATPHVYVAMARDGLFFRSFGKKHPKTQAPVLGLLLQAAAALAYLFSGYGGLLIDSVAFAEWIFFSLAGFSLFVLRKKEPDLHRPYHAFGYPWIPGLFCLLAIGVVVGALTQASFETTRLGLGVLAGGAIAYLIWRAATGTRAPEAIEPDA
ncbi:MAG: amino acid permease [Planctomycetota bacterium]